MTYATLLGHRDIQLAVGAFSGPNMLLVPSIDTTVSVVIYKAPEKKKIASGDTGAYLLSIPTGWDIKIVLHAHMKKR